MVRCIYDTVSERDMDMLFLESISSDYGFASIFVNKVEKLRGSTFRVISIELSKVDKNLGESDITVIIEVDGKRIGLLIEDKLNAIAMDQQANRYTKRGEIGVKNNDYSEFFVFIICPQKYRDTNAEAVKYEHYVSYEECKEYFDKNDSAINEIRSQQIASALHKAKHVSQTEIDENANAFLKRYITFKNERPQYAELNLRTNPNGNGYWIEFLSNYRKMWITHKANFGAVDLTFSKASMEISRLQEVAMWLRAHGMPEVTATVVGSSAALRICVPVIDVTETYFGDVPDEAIEEALEAVKKLNDLASILEKVRLISSGNRNK